MNYKFYGWKVAQATPIDDRYKKIENPRVLYDYLSKIWCADTCAPRMRDEWTEVDMTLGQCSITAFLTQDIFGGKVYGILRPGGNYHCFNVIGDSTFDLTSEQFTQGMDEEVLAAQSTGEDPEMRFYTSKGELFIYKDQPEQFREIHFQKEEKRLRYEYLKQKLQEALAQD